jgi:hypothetical protein
VPLQQLTNDFAVDFADLMLHNRGNVNLYVQVIDELSPNKVMLFSRQHRIQINKKVYLALKNYKAEGLIDYQVN